MPVRKARVLEHGNEHRRHTMQRHASLRCDGAEHGFGVEALVRVNHRRAVRDANQIAEHHAKTVVQRHGNAQAIDFAEVHRCADEVAIVEDVVMRQRGALGPTGSPRRELNVDGVVELQRGAHGLEVRELSRKRLS